MGVKILKFFDEDPGSGMKTVWIRDTGWKKVGSGINIPDPQHWFSFVSTKYCVYVIVSIVFAFVSTVFTFVSTVFTFVSTVFTFVNTVFTFVVMCLPSSVLC